MYGILSHEKAEILWSKICKRKGKGDGLSVSSSSPAKPSKISKDGPAAKKIKRVIDDTAIIADTGRSFLRVPLPFASAGAVDYNSKLPLSTGLDIGGGDETVGGSAY